jgi:integrase
LDTSKSLLKHYGTENYLPQQACEAILQGDSIPPEVSVWYAKHGAVPLMDSPLKSCPSREHLIVRLFIICGLRVQELFVLRVDDIESGILRIDEALKESEKGSSRVGDTKSRTSNGWVSMSPELEKEIRMWLQLRNVGYPYHRTAAPDPNDLLFPTETGTPFRIGNYLKRVLKPLAVKAGIPDLTCQALRRTFATHFQRYGSPKDAQTQLRHSKLEMTGWYMKEIPETVRTAVEKMDSDICRQEEKPPESPGSIQ